MQRDRQHHQRYRSISHSSRLGLNGAVQKTRSDLLAANRWPLAHVHQTADRGDLDLARSLGQEGCSRHSLRLHSTTATRQRGAEVATKRAVRVILLCQEGMRASAAGLRSGKNRRRKKPPLGGLLEISESFQNLETDQCLPVPIHPDG